MKYRYSDMPFHTSTHIPPLSPLMEHHHSIFSMGSCFAVNMAARFRRYRFSVMENPFGILYNPLSIDAAAERLASGLPFTMDNLHHHNDLWHSFYHHGNFSHPDAAKALAAMNEPLEKGRAFLQKAHWCILTFGTAGVFFRQDTGEAVANCHRFPGDFFTRRRLTIQESEAAMRSTLNYLRSINPSLRFILTVSPVRYWRDGQVESNRSKATLLLAVESCTGEEGVDYFPSYEIITDDLRDYRFFNRDMSHPTEEAVDHVWNRFSEAWIDSSSYQSMAEVEKLVRTLEHRPRFPELSSHRKGLEKLLQQIRNLTTRYPFLDMEEDIRNILHRMETYDVSE